MKNQNTVWKYSVLFVIVLATALFLRAEGRNWWCACGRLYLWTSDTWSEHTSQHLFDPYSFTHLLHGFIFFGMLSFFFRRAGTGMKFSIALIAESVWEVVENSETVISRYREVTAALGYHGDSIANSMGDILSCAVGFWIASHLGLWRSVILFLLVEVLLVVWIRDSLILEIIMLVHPVAAIKTWQTG